MKKTNEYKKHNIVLCSFVFLIKMIKIYQNLYHLYSEFKSQTKLLYSVLLELEVGYMKGESFILIVLKSAY